MIRASAFFSLLFLVSLPPLAEAQPAAPLTDCDRYAGRGLTNEEIWPGVSFEEIDPKLALPACEDAIQRYPDSNRLRFQLARVMLKIGQFEQAYALLSKLATKYDGPAMQALGTMYANGQGVDRSDQIAFELFRRSAEEGDAYGQFSLGSFYEQGRGTDPDYELANLWYNKSADQGFVLAKARLAKGPLGPTATIPVTAGGAGIVPGAIICPDYGTLTRMFDLYSLDWGAKARARLTKGESKLLEGKTSVPDLASYGCGLVPSGAAMTLEPNHAVPVVTVMLQDGRKLRGVTLPAMVRK